MLESLLINIGRMMSDTNANALYEADFEANFEADEKLFLEKGEAKNQGVPLFTSHWHIFAPTLIIMITYSFSWVFLASVGMSDTHLARLFIVVMAVFVPLLAAHAFLRYQTIRLQVCTSSVMCHSGWPKEYPVEIPFAMIEDIVIKRGLSGRIFGGGTLVLELPASNKVVVTDLAKPDEAKSAISQAIKLHFNEA